MPIYILNGKEIDVPENEVDQLLKAFPLPKLWNKTEYLPRNSYF